MKALKTLNFVGVLFNRVQWSQCRSIVQTTKINAALGSWNENFCSLQKFNCPAVAGVKQLNFLNDPKGPLCGSVTSRRPNFFE